MKFEITYTEYVSNHGAMPRGRGSWAFIFADGNLPPDYPNDAVWFAPGSLTFAEAKKAAKLEAARRFPAAHHVSIGVCS